MRGGRYMGKIRVVHYINQFFAGIGGEEMADHKPEVREGFVGPGMALNGGFKDEAEIIATVICGDSYFGENTEEALAEVLELIKAQNPDFFIAGPAFNAGRYGFACGTVADAVQTELGIPVLTGMYVENPGADIFKKSLYITSTRNSAAGMRDAVKKMVPLALKLARGEEVGTPEEENYLERGIRKNFFTDKRGSERAVDMLVKKLKGEEFQTEYPMPVFDRVAPNPAIKDITKAKIALVTSGGIVPHGNPDHIESSSASKYGKYDISGVMDLKEGEWETAHGGHDPVYANLDADRVLPVDVLRDLEKEGKIGELHRYFYSTVGNGTAVASAKGFAEEFSKELLADGVDAVILTST
jgi:glycine reductase